MKSVLFIFIISVIFFTGCDKEDEVVNPSGPTNVTEYEGSSDQGKNCSIKIGDISGKSYILKYSVSYTYPVLGGTATETTSSENSAGIAEVQNNSFTINVNTNSPKGTITGQRNNDSVTGNFNFQVIRISNDTITVAGTFNLAKKQ